jgi:GAF domain-containing protein
MEPSVKYDPVTDSLRPLTPELKDAEARQRAARISALGLKLEPDAFLDGFAREVADAANVFLKNVVGEAPVQPVAFVNLITDRQFASGLSLEGPAGESPEFRSAPADTGYCPHVVTRGLALVLDDVCDYPRFASNPIIDALGVRTYVGAPLIHQGVAIGTVCVVDQEEHAWGQAGLNFIKARANELMTLIHREGVLG